MKIQKQLSKKIGEKIYYKYVIVVPELKIEEAGLQIGDDLVAESSKNTIILRKREK